MMQNNLLRVFLFIVVNCLLVFLHFRLFNIQPVYGFGTGLVHCILLIIFPYSRLLKNTDK